MRSHKPRKAPSGIEEFTPKPSLWRRVKDGITDPIYIYESYFSTHLTSLVAGVTVGVLMWVFLALGWNPAYGALLVMVIPAIKIMRYLKQDPRDRE